MQGTETSRLVGPISFCVQERCVLGSVSCGGEELRMYIYPCDVGVTQYLDLIGVACVLCAFILSFCVLRSMDIAS